MCRIVWNLLRPERLPWPRPLRTALSCPCRCAGELCHSPLRLKIDETGTNCGLETEIVPGKSANRKLWYELLRTPVRSLRKVPRRTLPQPIDPDCPRQAKHTAGARLAVLLHEALLKLSIAFLFTVRYRLPIVPMGFDWRLPLRRPAARAKGGAGPW